jgi:hypothetical protein
LYVVDVGGRRYFSREYAETRVDERFRAYAGARVLGEYGVEYGVRHLVGDFVGMAFGNGFGSEKEFFGHGKAKRSRPDGADENKTLFFEKRVWDRYLKNGTIASLPSKGQEVAPVFQSPKGLAVGCRDARTGLFPSRHLLMLEEG